MPGRIVPAAASADGRTSRISFALFRPALAPPGDEEAEDENGDGGSSMIGTTEIDENMAAFCAAWWFSGELERPSTELLELAEIHGLKFCASSTHGRATALGIKLGAISGLQFKIGGDLFVIKSGVRVGRHFWTLKKESHQHPF